MLTIINHHYRKPIKEMQSVFEPTHADSPLHVYGSAAASESRISHLLPLLGIEDHSPLPVWNEITPEYLPLAFNTIGCLLVLLLSQLLDVKNGTFRQMVKQDPKREILGRIMMEVNTV